MKTKLSSLLIFILLIFTSCGKCGKDVDLGEFKLMPKSIEDWCPYNEVNELTFINTEGAFMTLQIEERKEEMMHNVTRDICSEGNIDYALEFFWGEYRYVKYQGIYDGINYSIFLSLQVSAIYYNDGNPDLRLRDFVTYSFNIFNNSGYLFGGIYTYTVDYRGNAIPNEMHDNCIPDFLNMVDINGNTYNDVWYFYRESAPSYYIQQGRGIIAFQGLNNEVWELQ